MKKSTLQIITATAWMLCLAGVINTWIIFGGWWISAVVGMVFYTLNLAAIYVVLLDFCRDGRGKRPARK